jgi:hypothetical protein
LFRRSACRVALVCTGKINPASRNEKWGSKNPVHGLLLLEGWKVMLVGCLVDVKGYLVS